MWRLRLKSGLAKVGELLLVLTLVLVFFAAVLRFMDSLFPSGMSLNTMVSRGGLFSKDMAERKTRVQTQPLIAKLSTMRNRVKRKGAGDIAWNTAVTGMPLYNRDAVQTLAKSGARIDFDNHSYLNLAENSLVIIKRFEQNTASLAKRSVVVMMQGSLQGHVETAPGEAPLAVELALPHALARVTPPAAGGDAQFRIAINADQSSTVFVLKGSAEVEAQGKIVQVGADQSTTIMPEQAPSVPARALEYVVAQRPVDGMVYTYRDLPPRVEFAWKAANAADSYHFMLAKDRAFTQRVSDEHTSALKFSHGNLKPGDYYWRVAAVVNGADAPFSEARQLRLVQDRQAPQLQVEFPVEALNVPQLTLQGQTEVGAELRVAGHTVKPDKQGGFSHALTLQSGLNVVVVEAEDAAGNVAYSSRIINVKARVH